MFFLGPIVTLVFALLGFAVIPFGPALSLSDLYIGILYMLAVSSLDTYGILLAGWSVNSKYAFLGLIRSTAQLISYELVLSSILLIIFITSTLNLNNNVQFQKIVWLALPFLCIFIMYVFPRYSSLNK